MRQPNVNGTFYPSKEQELKELVQKLITQAKTKNKGIVISPHAGLTYSGLCAAHSFKSLKKANTFIILGTNHNCMGSSIITDDENEWITPLGNIKIDLGLKEKLKIEINSTPFNYEHSIEVQLPFLQTLFPQSKFFPILLNPQTFTIKHAEELGKKIKDYSIIASSDLTHYGKRFEHASNDDEQIINEILKLDSKNFYEKRLNRTVCGWPCILTIMEIAKLKNLKPELVKYYNSSIITNTPRDWVGYASIVFK
ncbi:MAG: AmmeMemoRadiSam system protein B [Nanoarchaeota archaeon]|nr:AmmeMemoRadiSam system protein B [Nanoarchaeota archaeon]